MDTKNFIKDYSSEAARLFRSEYTQQQIEAVQQIRLQWESECQKMLQDCMEKATIKSDAFKSDLYSIIRLYTTVGIQKTEGWLNHND